SKKPRFDYRNPSTLAADAPEEDAILELDEIGKGGQQTKRNAVNLDGFESDSSNENFDTRAADKARLEKLEKRGGQHRSKDEEENDMFADLEDDFQDGDDDEELSREGKTKKSVKFLDTDDIEGQVANSKAGGHVSADFDIKGKGQLDKDAESSSSESGGEEERDRVGSDVDEELGAGAKKKHAPKLDAFNMKQEGEEGRFDESGNYIRKAVDPDAVHDSWMEGVSKKDMKRAAEAHEKREKERREKAVAEDEMLTSDILATLIKHLEKGETILEALGRLNKGRKVEKKEPKWKKNKRKNANGGEAMDVDSNPEEKKEDPAETKRREAVEAIGGAANQLLTRGQTDIYEQEREMLVRQWQRETGEEWVDAAGEGAEGDDQKMWEYRWANGAEKYGPFDGAMMRQWSESGYFAEGVEFRRVGDSGWERSVEF
ncbi:hypothetical protein K490DRAFT_2433, partial [Saccharata proteae CBS 121410]